jgi:hypothetical protein
MDRFSLPLVYAKAVVTPLAATFLGDPQDTPSALYVGAVRPNESPCNGDKKQIDDPSIINFVSTTAHR